MFDKSFFSVTSNSRYYEGQKTHTFIQKLPQPLRFDGEWLVALHKIQYPHSWRLVGIDEDPYIDIEFVPFWGLPPVRIPFEKKEFHDGASLEEYLNKEIDSALATFENQLLLYREKLKMSGQWQEDRQSSITNYQPRLKRSMSLDSAMSVDDDIPEKHKRALNEGMKPNAAFGRQQTEAARLEEERKKNEAAAKKIEEDKRKAAAAARKAEDDKKKAEAAARKAEEDKKKAEAAAKKAQEDQLKAVAAQKADEAKKAEEDRKKAELAAKKADEDKKKAEAAAKKAEEDKKKAALAAKKAEDEKKKLEAKKKKEEEERKQREEEERKRLEEEAQRLRDEEERKLQEERKRLEDEERKRKEEEAQRQRDEEERKRLEEAEQQRLAGRRTLNEGLVPNAEYGTKPKGYNFVEEIHTELRREAHEDVRAGSPIRLGESHTYNWTYPQDHYIILDKPRYNMNTGRTENPKYFEQMNLNDLWKILTALQQAKLKFQHESKRFVTIFDNTKIASIELSSELRYIMGYAKQDKIRANETSSFLADVKAAIHGFVVYETNGLIQKTIFGDQMASVLKHVTVRGHPGDVIEEVFQYPEWKPVLASEISELSFEIRTLFGAPVPFQWGTITMTLMLKRAMGQ